MRILSFRLIVSLVLGITLVSVLSSYYEVRVEEHGLRRDLERRAAVLGESLTGNVERSLEQGTPRELQRLVERFGNREHLAGIAVYDVLGNRIAVTPALTQAYRQRAAHRSPGHPGQPRARGVHSLG